MVELSKHLRETLSFIESFTRENGYPPSIREIAKEIRVTIGAVQKQLKKLEKLRLIKKQGGLSRGIQVIKKDDRIPIFAFVKAGSPGFADEEPIDYLTVEGTLGLKEGDRGMLVRGDSMNDAGITNGSIVFYRKADYVNENAIIIARVKEGPVVKRFSKSGGKILLKSENVHYKPIVIDHDNGSEDFEILGKVISVVKNYEKTKRRQVN